MRAERLDPLTARLAVARKVRAVALTQARLDRLRAELDEELDAAQRRRGGPIAALQARLSRLLADLEALCRAQRALILPPGRKGLATPFGEVGFRRAEPLLRLREGLTDEEACRLLRKADLDDLIRVKETPDRQAAHKALSEGRVGPERLRRCGLELSEPPERFHCRLREHSLDACPALGRTRP